MKKLLSVLLLSVLSINIFAQVGDCPAQFTCTGGSYTATTDITDELNSSNQGCLASNEGTTSYWFRVCTSTAGTIQFTIAPSGNNNDYDWAVWTGSTCPPVVAPIRCSYAVSSAGPNGDNTGVNSLLNAPQTDNSEGVFGNQWVNDIIAPAGQCYIININNYGTGSNNFDISFGGTAQLQCVALPIELLYFDCYSIDNRIELRWSTSTETNSDRFEIEHSLTGVSWITIGTITAQGNSIQPYNYIYSDNIPQQGTNYYRLKMIDLDGSYTYSGITSCISKGTKIIETYYDVLGREVDSTTKGLILVRVQIGNQVTWNKIYKQ